MRALTDGRVFTGEEILTGHAVLLDGATIRDVVPERELPPPDAAPRHGLDGDLLAPGFIDCQVNGGGGVLLNDAPDAATIAALGAAHRRFGTTALLPTLISDGRDQVRAALDGVRSAMATPDPGGAEVLGVHVEGPHLNHERRGVHDPREAPAARAGGRRAALLPRAAGPHPGHPGAGDRAPRRDPGARRRRRDRRRRAHRGELRPDPRRPRRGGLGLHAPVQRHDAAHQP